MNQHRLQEVVSVTQVLEHVPLTRAFKSWNIYRILLIAGGSRPLSNATYWDCNLVQPVHRFAEIATHHAFCTWSHPVCAVAMYMGATLTGRCCHRPLLRSSLQDALRKIHDSLKTMPAEGDEEIDPVNLKSSVSLFPHQKQALAWLLWRETQDPPGGILADDMGLGKTLEMLALILKHKASCDSNR